MRNSVAMPARGNPSRRHCRTRAGRRLRACASLYTVYAAGAVPEFALALALALSVAICSGSIGGCGLVWLVVVMPIVPVHAGPAENHRTGVTARHLRWVSRLGRLTPAGQVLARVGSMGTSRRPVASARRPAAPTAPGPRSAGRGGRGGHRPTAARRGSLDRW